MTADRIRAHFEDQAGACAGLGSPFTAHLCRILPDLLDPATRTGARVLGWAGDPGADALALRLCGALHFEREAGTAPALAAVYPPADWEEAPLGAAVAGTIAARDAEIAAFLDSPPQTNEVARSGVLLGALLEIAARTGAALELNEIGASAGLNLRPDAWRYEFGAGRVWGAANAPVLIESAWAGAPPALGRSLVIVDRAGCDIAPVDPANPAARARMLAYLWPDQSARMARARAALDVIAARGPAVEAASADAWVAARLARPQEKGVARVLMHSIMWQYMPAPVQERIAAAMAAAGARATPSRPLAWARLEPGGRRRADGDAGADLSLTLWPGGEPQVLALAAFHGQWVDWGG